MTMRPLDLGHGVTLRFTVWSPDRDLNPQYDGIPDVDPWGAILAHPLPDGGICEGALAFDGPVQQRVEPDRPRWTVERLDPLTLSPSVLCDCGFHGFVREGRWVPC